MLIFGTDLRVFTLFRTDFRLSTGVEREPRNNYQNKFQTIDSSADRLIGLGLTQQSNPVKNSVIICHFNFFITHYCDKIVTSKPRWNANYNAGRSIHRGPVRSPKLSISTPLLTWQMINSTISRLFNFVFNFWWPFGDEWAVDLDCDESRLFELKTLLQRNTRLS